MACATGTMVQVCLEKQLLGYFLSAILVTMQGLMGEKSYK